MSFLYDRNDNYQLNFFLNDSNDNCNDRSDNYQLNFFLHFGHLFKDGAAFAKVRHSVAVHLETSFLKSIFSFLRKSYFAIIFIWWNEELFIDSLILFLMTLLLIEEIGNSWKHNSIQNYLNTVVGNYFSGIFLKIRWEATKNLK